MFRKKDKDKNLKELNRNSYKSVRVSGRGAIHIDPVEVRNSSEFKEAQKKAKAIVEMTSKKNFSETVKELCKDEDYKEAMIEEVKSCHDDGELSVADSMCDDAGLSSAYQARLMIESCMRKVEKAIRNDPAHADWYISAKEHLAQADSELSFCIND